MRLIDGDRLEDALREHKFDYSGETEYNDGVVEGLMMARDDVIEAPTIDAEPTINEKKIIKDFLLKCSKICNDDCDKCPMYIQRAYDEKLCFFDFFDNFQFLDNVRKMDDVITGVLDYEVN